METMQGRGEMCGSLIVAILATALLCAASALAAEESPARPTKPPWSRFAKQTPKPTNILGGVRAKVKAGKRAGGVVIHQGRSRLQGTTLGRIKAKPEPAADEERLSAQCSNGSPNWRADYNKSARPSLEENHHKAASAVNPPRCRRQSDQLNRRRLRLPLLSP